MCNTPVGDSIATFSADHGHVQPSVAYWTQCRKFFADRAQSWWYKPARAVFRLSAFGDPPKNDPVGIRTEIQHAMKISSSIATRLWLSVALPASLCIASSFTAQAADTVSISPDTLNPTPIVEQQPAVDGVNFKASALTGVIGGYGNHMFVLSAATGIPYFSQFGAQLDLGIGNYRSDYISSAAGLHLFWRDPSVGLLGIYGDWGYVNPEHAGRVGVEAAFYLDRWTLDIFAGKQFGQHVYTKFVDEVDLSYYFTDNLRGSIGHRLISRGHVGNVAFEFMPQGSNGWSVFAEAEAGEDDYYGAWVGLRYSFGTSPANTLLERDRTADAIVRIPRNIASVTQCGTLPHSNPETWWRAEMTNLCASEEEIHAEGATVGKQ
jgi:hypothetical protein